MTVSVDLRLGDCLDVLPTLDSASVDAVIMDPPYFLPAISYVGKRGEGATRRTMADASILKRYFDTVFVELARILKPTGTYYVFCDGQSYPIFYQVMYPYCKYVRPIIWDKMTSFTGYTWRHQHELIAWGELDESPRIPTGDGDILQVRAVPVDDRIHPAEKPLGVLHKLINKSVPVGGVVLDPFCGSASTGEACMKSGRGFIGIEMEEKFYAIAQRRIAEAQAQPALFQV